MLLTKGVVAYFVWHLFSITMSEGFVSLFDCQPLMLENLVLWIIKTDASLLDDTSA